MVNQPIGNNGLGIFWCGHFLSHYDRNLSEILHFYSEILQPYQEEIWETVFNQHDIDFQKVYLCKNKYIPDRKLSELNFKVLHLILPCDLNLRRWGQKNDDICVICGVTHDIVHMLFFCEKARQIWNLIGQTFNVQVSLKHVVLTDSYNDMSFLFSLISFLSYKEWLLFSVNEIWRTHNIIAFLIREFIYLFGVLRRFQHCTGHIMTGSWKGRGNQYIQFVRVMYCKLLSNGKQLPLEIEVEIKNLQKNW